MRRQRVIADCKKALFRNARSSVFDYKSIETMVEQYKKEMARDWADEEKTIRWSNGNSKTGIPSYSTMPGLDCIRPDGSFPPCFTSGACYALRDIIYPECLGNAVHNSVLIRKYPEAFQKSLMAYINGGEK